MKLFNKIIKENIKNQNIFKASLLIIFNNI